LHSETQAEGCSQGRRPEPCETSTYCPHWENWGLVRHAAKFAANVPPLGTAARRSKEQSHLGGQSQTLEVSCLTFTRFIRFRSGSCRSSPGSKFRHSSSGLFIEGIAARNARHRRRCASAIRARPAFLLGPVDMPPCNRQRRFPGTTLMRHGAPALVLAQHLGRSLRFKGSPVRDRPRSSISRHQCRSRQVPSEHARPVLGQLTIVFIS